jgi:hypothetical protein
MRAKWEEPKQKRADPNHLEEEGKKIGDNLGCVLVGIPCEGPDMAFSVPCCRSLNRKSIC